jgi:hypothetical protein
LLEFSSLELLNNILVELEEFDLAKSFSQAFETDMAYPFINQIFSFQEKLEDESNKVTQSNLNTQIEEVCKELITL